MFYNSDKLDSFDMFSACLYLGDKPDLVHRIVAQQDEYRIVQLSVHDIALGSDVDADEFFVDEDYWFSQSPLKEYIADIMTKM